MAEKCTNTSSPVERWMNPYPFAPLNHFTVPFSLTAKLLSQSRRMFSGVLDRRSGRLEAPSKMPVELAVASTRAKEILQKRKDSSVLTAVFPPCEHSEPDNLARFHHTANVNH